MALTKKEVEHIAHLARLNVSDAELDRYAEQLSGILSYVEQLQKVNTDSVESTAQVTGLENVMRNDVIEQVNGDVIKKSIALAPESEDNLIKAKAVF